LCLPWQKLFSIFFQEWKNGKILPVMYSTVTGNEIETFHYSYN